MRQSFPFLVNWPDRRPIARWFISEGSDTSATNPRGYLWDTKINVANQTAFSALILAQTDSVIANLNAMTPKPQGVIMWDLEGQEFQQPFTYVGNPPKLHEISPEMDVIADQMFAKVKAAGYLIGMTLRPSDFQTGTVLPSTCHNDDINLRDVFIRTDAAYPYRGYICTAPNTWTQAGNRLPNYQKISNDDSTTLGFLEAKVKYAHARWGARLFYVDSTVYTQGASFNAYVFRQLQIDFPDCLFFPENFNYEYWSAGAPYKQGNQGYLDTPVLAKFMYPCAFTMLQVTDGVNYNDPKIVATLIQAVKNGNILFVDGWYTNPTNNNILQIYQKAYDNKTVNFPCPKEKFY